ncbi:MAG: RraA family protein [Acidimicrobiia bacterium]|nr:RraA family protein [Acidimicrobiia bacterium]
MPWSNDEQMFSLARRQLFTAVIGDIMDKIGLRRQFLPPYIQPLDRGMTAVGRAMTVLQSDCEDGAGGAQPFGLMLDALDDLKPGEIYLCSAGSPPYALWGELMSTRAMRCGAAGAVLDGYLRDTHGILKLGFPCFSRGCYAQDQAGRGKVSDFRVSIQIGGVHVSPGDIVFADVDGVCIVPRHAEREVFERALEKVQGENVVREALEQGMPAREAFDRFGIL